MTEKTTPIRRQYLKVKQQYPDDIVLFRLGDFYETFDDDARLVSRELEITLTSKVMGKNLRVPLAGIPYHALNSYLSRLIKNGHRVAICEQLTKAGEGRLVEREVIRVVTPGTVVEPELLDSKSNNYLVSVVIGGKDAGVACVDITTSEFATTQLPLSRLQQEIKRLNPSEIIIAENTLLDDYDITAPVNRIEDYWFEEETARQLILTQFQAATLESYGCDKLPLAVGAAGAVLHYLKETQGAVLEQLVHLSTYHSSAYMALDAISQYNLSLFSDSRIGAKDSLLSVLDLTKTAMGGRALRRWLSQPLLNLEGIEQREGAVDWFFQQALVREPVIKLLGQVADLERLINRVRGKIASPRELVALRRSLELIPEIREELLSNDASFELVDSLKPQPDAIGIIESAITEQPPATLSDGGVIREGFSEELDKLRKISLNGKQYLAELEQKEKERTGIKSLKIGFNNVFGYYLEISRSNLAQVPPEYIRKQTLVNGERFFTPELKEYESMILNAGERIQKLEASLYHQVCAQVALAGEPVLSVAAALARLDVFTALAEVAVRNGYVRPKITSDNKIIIKDGRHPVVERSLGAGAFVANDTQLDRDDTQLIILTGPNMAGKSTYLKQVALIVLMAQIGSFVPAEQAEIGLVDRIFTRIGAREDLSAGQSTFMVEMVETANILHNATERSLLILDEIGRGTSTYDGLAIARAVSEYIHNRLGARTIFATHYHEMVELAALMPRVKNFNVAVTEEAGEVVFLRKIIPGGVDKSYGIHVAKLAGLPKAVLARAREVLDELEGSGQPPTDKKHGSKIVTQQLSLLAIKPELVKELEVLNLEAMTPLDALNTLFELQRKAKES